MPFTVSALWPSPYYTFQGTHLMRINFLLTETLFSSIGVLLFPKASSNLPLQLSSPLPALTTKDASPLRFGTFLSEKSLSLLELKLLSLFSPLLPGCLFQLFPGNSSPLLRSCLLNLHSFSILPSASGSLFASYNSELPTLSVQYLLEPVGCEFPCLP